jgi:predicted CoA-binding protein
MLGIMNHDRYDDSYIRGILNTVKTVAMVGASAKDNRPSYFAFKYLAERGYNMIPINPGLGGKELLGRKIYARLSEVPEPIDMIDIFRASKYALPVVQEALTLTPKPRVIWMQLGIRNDEAARIASDAGLDVVMNHCVKIEHARILGGLNWAGVNTGVISARRPA